MAWVLGGFLVLLQSWITSQLLPFLPRPPPLPSTLPSLASEGRNWARLLTHPPAPPMCLLGEGLGAPWAAGLTPPAAVSGPPVDVCLTFLPVPLGSCPPPHQARFLPSCFPVPAGDCGWLWPVRCSVLGIAGTSPLKRSHHQGFRGSPSIRPSSHPLRAFCWKRSW